MKRIVKPLLYSTLALSPLFASLEAVADITIEVPSEVDIFAANEKSVKLEGGFFSDTKSLTLPDGQVQLVFKYELMFEEGKENHFVESNEIIATFYASDTTIVFEFPEYKNLYDAESKIKNLQWGLREKNGASIAVSKDELNKSGVQIGRNFVREIAEYNQLGEGEAVWSNAKDQTQLAQTATQANSALTATATAKSNTTPVATDNVAEEMLHYWYAKADEKTRQKFKAFINQ